VALSNDINGEQVVSLRSLVEDVQQATGNTAATRIVLDRALISGGQFVWLGRFHLDQQDIQDEIANSYDPDVEEAVLARVYGGEPMHVVAAAALLYAGLDTTALGLLAGDYVTDPNPLGDCVSNILLPHWEALRASVLETRHDIEIPITKDQYMGIPNAAETFREMRFLAARSEIPTDIALLLEKVPPDLYLQEVAGATQAIDFNFEPADDIVTQAPITTPPGLNIADVHLSDLFGRAVLGKWALSFTYKGNKPALPALDLVELEILHTYFEHH
jgi:hypothetical protein